MEKRCVLIKIGYGVLEDCFITDYNTRIYTRLWICECHVSVCVVCHIFCIQDEVLQDQLLYPHRGDYEELFVMLVFFVCFAVTIALLLLGGWHIYLVTVAETSIEVHVNRKAQKENGVSVQFMPIKM